jgi:hypothetical protein
LNWCCSEVLSNNKHTGSKKRRTRDETMNGNPVLSKKHKQGEDSQDYGITTVIQNIK